MNVTMNDKLKAMREKLAQQQNQGGGGDGASYPFWNLPQDPPNNTCSLRFLPDKDQDNPFFYREKVVYRWTFPDPEKPQQKLSVTFPCIEQWEGYKSCKILNELRPMFKQDEVTAKKFWPKRSAIYQGIVRRSPIVEQSVPENRIRIFMMNRELHEYIKTSILSQDPDTMLPDSPDDYEKGRDFIIRKTPNGEYSSYKTSQWANNASALSDDERAVIAQHGLFDLIAKLPARPSAEAYEVAFEMLLVGIEGGAWRHEWDTHFKAYSDSQGGQGGSRGGNQGGSREEAKPAARSSGGSALDRLKGASKPTATVQPKDEDPDDEPPFAVDAPVATVTPTVVPPAGKTDIMARLAAMREKAKA